MSFHSQCIILFLCCLALYVFILVRCRSGLLGLTFLNVFQVGSASLSAFGFGLLFNLNDDWIDSEHVTVFWYSGIALISMGTGIWIAWSPLRRSPAEHGVPAGIHFNTTPWVTSEFALLFILVGAFAYAAYPFVQRVPTVNTICANLMAWLRIGILIALLHGKVHRNYKAFLLGLALFAPLSIMQMLLSGHAPASTTLVIPLLIVAFFSMRVTAGSFLLGAVSVIILAFAMSIWMNSRSLLRSGELESLDYMQRAQEVGSEMLNQKKSADLSPQAIQELLFLRIDMSELLAQQVSYQPLGEPYAHGKTFFSGFVSLVPRFIWRDKPMIAGGSDFVSRYTGTVRPEEDRTSVGIPYQFELYANGGPYLVIIGLFVIGWVTAKMELVLFRPFRSLKQILPLIVTTMVICSGGERFSIYIASVGAAAGGAYLLGFFIEFTFPEFHARALGLKKS